MATQNAINKKSQDLTIDPGASGDSYVQFDINTTGEFRIGVDDDASDAFKISQGSALGGTDTFIMSAAGERTMPLNSCFSAQQNSVVSNVTGDGTTYTLTFTTEIFDQNADFDGTSTFTAPVTGRYLLIFLCELSDVAAAHTSGYLRIVTSNRTYSNCIGDYGNMYSTAAPTADTLAVNFQVIADMDAADTATCTVTVSNGTKVIDIDGSTTNVFMGCLLC